MNDLHGLTAENFLREFPFVLSEQRKIFALAQAIALELRRHYEAISEANIYSRIDDLPEAILNTLAFDLKIDWWNGDYSVEQKRQTLKNAWQIYRTMGTKAAVETALSAVYPDAKVQEWFEYGGEPYHFRISFDRANEDIGSVHYQRVMRLITFYKNLRSHFDGIFFRIPLTTNVATGYVGSGIRLQTCQRIRTNVAIPSTMDAPELYAGIGVRTQVRQYVRTNIAVPATMNAPALYAGLGVRIQTCQHVRAVMADYRNGATWGELLSRGVTWEETLDREITWGELVKEGE